MIKDLSEGSVRFYQIHLGGDRNFCYLLGDGDAGVGVAVDPGFAPDRLAEIVRSEGLILQRILITHGHGDHTGGAARLQALTGAALHAGPADKVPGADPVHDGQTLSVGNLAVSVLASPGHSPGHCCYLFEGRLLTGDILFCGKVGGTGSFFPGSSARQEWDSLQKLLKLPPATRVFPGHDYYGGEGEMPHSSIGYEKENNPFLTVPDFEAFCHLKDHWAAYKKEHGIR